MTEVVWDSLNPKFTHKFIIQTEFIEIQSLILEVFDTEENEVYNGVPKINKERLIGQNQIEFNSVVRSFGKKVQIDIIKKDKTKQGHILI